MKIGSLPRIRFNRSTQNLSYGYKTAFNEGQLIPIYLQEVFPGDNHRLETSFVIRTSSPFIRPIMDNIFIDIHYFFTPNRLVFDKWKSFMGENTQGYWTNTEEVTIPQTYGVGNDGIIPVGSIADYFGLNNGTINSPELTVQSLPFRDYALIYNEWWRDENLQEPVYIHMGSTTQSEAITDVDFGPSMYTGMPAQANKLRDYFTSCLPEPQKGDAVNIPVSGMLPVGPLAKNWQVSEMANFLKSPGTLYSTKFMRDNFATIDATSSLVSSSQNVLLGLTDVDFDYNKDYVLNFANLGADASQLYGTINDLRFAVQFQKYLERDSQYGTRYIEYLAGHWGIDSSDKTMQRPQYLAGKRSILNLTQVTQTSQSSESSPLAQVSAYSLTNGKQGFSRAFEEHGFIIGLACVRHLHSYQQGNPKFFTQRVNKIDYYDPLFANLGEQPVFTRELYSNTAEIDGTEVFGYNEAFADLRSRQSIVTGALKSSANNGLDVWHMADEYNSRPYLNGEWIKEDGSYLDRCLSVPSSSLPNFICDFYHKNQAIRVMPAYSMPGFMDHH